MVPGRNRRVGYPARTSPRFIAGGLCFCPVLSLQRRGGDLGRGLLSRPILSGWVPQSTRRLHAPLLGATQHVPIVYHTCQALAIFTPDLRITVGFLLTSYIGVGYTTARQMGKQTGGSDMRVERVKMSLQVPDETRRQLGFLQAYYGTMTSVVIVAVAALYREVRATASGNDAVEPVEAEGAK